jgi:wyosine [tRNA(Phe)-imidazoG37] synthetase (radical SAM superfamily)
MGRRALFGPVPSRRLGRSLGIDLLARKTCTLDCVYCECGPTEELTLERREYVPTRAVLDELDAYLAGRPVLDSITFSGSGEPTLHLGIGNIINYIKDNYPEYPVTVLTNGTLLADPAVRAELVRADRVVPSLDAVSRDAFHAVNRPTPGLDNDDVIEGLVRFREEFRGQLWLEFFLVPGLNDAPDELAAVAAAAVRIRPDRVQLNSLDRPPAYAGILAPTPGRLLEVAAALDTVLVPALGFGVEIVARQFVFVPVDAVSPDAARTVLDTLRRRPLTLADVTAQTGLHVHEAHKLVAHLEETGQIIRDGDFYTIRKA